jgi:hypothetical protein
MLEIVIQRRIHHEKEESLQEFTIEAFLLVKLTVFLHIQT